MPLPLDILQSVLPRRTPRRERFSFAANGVMFLFAAFDGAYGTSPAPLWSVLVILVLGIVQCVAFVLALRRGSPLPDRLANLLAAAGMVVSAAVLRHHHFLIPTLYLVAGAIKLFRAWKGPEPHEPLPSTEEAASLPTEAAPSLPETP